MVKKICISLQHSICLADSLAEASASLSTALQKARLPTGRKNTGAQITVHLQHRITAQISGTASQQSVQT